MRLTVVLAPGQVAPGFGVRRQADELVACLADRGHELTVLASGSLPGALVRSRLPEGIQWINSGESPPVAHYDRTSQVVLDNVWLSEQALQHGRGCDAVVAFDWEAGLAAQALSEVEACPLVWFARGTEGGRSGAQLTEEQRYISETEQWLCGEAEHIVASSESVARELQSLSPEVGGKITTMRGGVNPASFVTSADLRDFRALFAQADVPILLFVGRMCRSKGPDLLLEALGHLDQRSSRVCALFVGDGALLPSLESRAGQLAPSVQVRFPGHLTGVVLATLYRVADVVVAPGRYEPTALVAREALSCGVRVVASACGAHAEMDVEGRQVLLVPPGEPEALAGAIVEQLSRPAEDAGPLSGAGCEENTWVRMAERLEALLAPRGRLEPLTGGACARVR